MPGRSPAQARPNRCPPGCDAQAQMESRPQARTEVRRLQARSEPGPVAMAPVRGDPMLEPSPVGAVPDDDGEDPEARPGTPRANAILLPTHSANANYNLINYNERVCKR